MNKLKEELKKFWNWAGITPEEYRNGLQPTHAIQSEWEDNYPYWRQLEHEIDNAINDLNQNWEYDLAKLIVSTIAIDNENGLVMDNCLEKLVESNRLIEMCCKSEQPYSRLEIAERIKNLKIPEHLQMLLLNDNDDRVRQVFLREIK